MLDEGYIKSGNVLADLSTTLLQQKVKHTLRTKKPYGLVLMITLQYAVMADDTFCKFGYFLDKMAFKPILKFGPRLTRREFDNLKRILLAIAVPLVLHRVPLWPKLKQADVRAIIDLLRGGMPEWRIAKLLVVNPATVHEIKLEFIKPALQTATTDDPAGSGSDPADNSPGTQL